MFSVRSIEIEVTNNCNLSCKYCYYTNKGADNMDHKTAYKVINDFYDKISNKQDHLYISFWGGEPLLNIDTIKYIVALCDSYVIMGYNRPYYLLMSNGTLLNDDIISYLNANSFYIQISMDGIDKIHDANRVYTNNSGSHKMIERNLLKLTESRNEWPEKKFHVKATFTSGPESKREAISYFEYMGFPYYISPALSYDRSDISYVTPEDIACIASDLFISYTNNLHSQNKNYKLNIIIDTYFNKVINGMRVQNACHATNGYAVSSKGKKYPCHLFIGNNKHCYNDNDDITFISIEQCKKVSKNNAKCKKCAFIEYCGGECYYVILNDLPSNYICNYRYTIIMNIFKYLIGLTSNKDTEKISYMEKEKVNLFSKTILCEHIDGYDESFIENKYYVIAKDVMIIDLNDGGILYSRAFEDKKFLANATMMCIIDMINNDFNTNEIVIKIADLCLKNASEVKSDIYKSIYQLNVLGYIIER